jgi:hypothetical protein
MMARRARLTMEAAPLIDSALPGSPPFRVSAATLYRKMAAKEFPKPVALGASTRAWPLSEVQDWIAERREAGKCNMLQQTLILLSISEPMTRA